MNAPTQGKGRELLLGTFIAVVSSLCTVGITTAGNYWLEINKSKLEIQKEGKLSRLHTLESIGSQLERLNTEVQFIDSLTKQAKNDHASLLYHAGFAAGIMAEIEEKRTALPPQSSAYLRISDLLDNLAPRLAEIQVGGAMHQPCSTVSSTALVSNKFETLQTRSSVTRLNLSIDYRTTLISGFLIGLMMVLATVSYSMQSQEGRDNNPQASYPIPPDVAQQLDNYHRDLERYRDIDDWAGEAQTLNNIGALYSEIGEPQAALEYYNQALTIAHGLRFRAGEARTLTNIGAVYSSTGEQEKALQYYKEALSILRAAGDRKGEATTLNNIGSVYHARGEPDAALNYFNQALPIAQEVKDRPGEARTLTNIGLVYSDLGEQQKALDSYNRALPIQHAAGDRAGEATTLSSIGVVYSHLGERQTALERYDQARSIEQAVGFRVGEARTLSNIGLVYSDGGEKQKALDYYNQALSIQRAASDRRGEAVTLSNIGAVYYALGEKQKALDYYNHALSILRATGDRRGEATTLNNIGTVYFALREKQKALDYYNQALSIVHKVGYRQVEATTLNNIGLVYSDLGEPQNALEYYNQALPIAHAVGDRAVEAITLANLGVVSRKQGDGAKALEEYRQALQLAFEVKDPLLEGGILDLLMKYWQTNNSSLAIFFGKQAVNAYQQVRGSVRGLDTDLQKTFVSSKSGVYRQLADLLITQGRLLEAQQVLDLLKEQEYRDFVRGDSDAQAAPVSLTSPEQRAASDLKGLRNQITAIAEQWAEFQRKSARTPAEEAQFKQLDDKLKQANQELERYFSNLYLALGKNDQSNRTVEVARETAAGLQSLVGDLGPGTVALYTLVAAGHYRVIVITPAVMVAREVSISSDSLRLKVFTATTALRDRQSDPQAASQELYKLLVAPIEDLLKGASAQTLVWSLDDVLRYIPIAALYDGKQYLLERYRNVVITGAASLSHLKDQPTTRLTGLAMGISKGYGGLPALPGVKDELNGIVHDPKYPESKGMLAGVIEMDDNFTEKNMAEQLSKNYPVIHIASHFAFQPGNDTDSYLLLSGKDAAGTGYRLTLAELRDEPSLRFKGADLLTLSACSTAVSGTSSDGREVDGLGTLAQRNGAKAVLATLWSVDDASTGRLMVDFYERWASTTAAVPKTEALQRAQLDLLRSNSKYSHPYYWGPFILMGNWR